MSSKFDFRPGRQEIRYTVREQSNYSAFRRDDLGKGISIVRGKTTKGKWEVQALRFKVSSGWTIPKARKWVNEHRNLTKIENLNKSEILIIQKGEFNMRIEDVTAKNVTELEKSVLFKVRNQLSQCFVPDYWHYAELVLKEISRRDYKKFIKPVDTAFEKRQQTQQFLNSLTNKLGEFEKVENDNFIVIPTCVESTTHFGHHFFLCDLDKGLSFVHCEECGLPAAYIFSKKQKQNWSIEKCERWVANKVSSEFQSVDKAAYASYNEIGEDEYKIVSIIPGQEKIAREAEYIEQLPYAGYRGMCVLYVTDLMRIVGAVFFKDSGWTKAKVKDFMAEFLSEKTIRSNSPAGMEKEDSLTAVEFTKRLDNTGTKLNIFKIDKKEHLISAVVYEPDVIDSDGEFMRKAAIREAAFNWMLVYGGTYKEQHKKNLSKRDAAVVETYLAPVSFAVEKEIITEGTWIATTKVFNKRIWKKIESGEITAYSIGGHGVRKPFDFS